MILYYNLIEVKEPIRMLIMNWIENTTFCQFLLYFLLYSFLCFGALVLVYLIFMFSILIYGIIQYYSRGLPNLLKKKSRQLGGKNHGALGGYRQSPSLPSCWCLQRGYWQSRVHSAANVEESAQWCKCQKIGEAVKLHLNDDQKQMGKW